MSDKNKTMAAPASKTLKSKRPSTVGLASSSRSRVPASTLKEKPVASRAKINKNSTILGEGDTTIMKQDNFVPDFDAENRQIAYGKFLRAMLEECMVDEKIEREETNMDVQMAQLADRFQKTMDQLDKTNKRLNEISFVVEQNRLLNLKNKDINKFIDITEKSNIEPTLHDLNSTEEACLGKLHLKNIDFGYNKESGHKQLLDAVNDAIEGFEQIKKHSNLDMNKFKEFEQSQKNMDDIDKDRFDLESLKSEFETKFPKFSEKLIKEVSENIVKMIEHDEEADDHDN